MEKNIVKEWLCTLEYRHMLIVAFLKEFWVCYSFWLVFDLTPVLLYVDVPCQCRPNLSNTVPSRGYNPWMWEPRHLNASVISRNWILHWIVHTICQIHFCPVYSINSKFSWDEKLRRFVRLKWWHILYVNCSNRDIFWPHG